MIERIESASAIDRLRAAAAFIGAAPPGAELLLVGASREAIDDLVRSLSSRRAATFGLHRFTLTQLAARLAAPPLSARGLATCTRLGAEAVAARATFEVLAAGAIPYFAPVARCPGFGATLASTVAELRGAGVDPTQLAAQGASVAQLGVLLTAYEAQLAAAGLADRATLLAAATAAVGSSAADPLTRMPLLLLDVPIDTAGERDLIAALCAAAPHGLATLPAGDRRSHDALTAIGAHPQPTAPAAPANSLGRLQRYLFSQETPPPGAPDDAVRFLSAPGEGRETVEIARRILAEARAGTPFDRMVVFLRSPEAYTARLETAFRRAGIPGYFARGTRRPNLAGRAFLALLGCALDGLSARRFAEYLSFGQVPQPAADGTPPVGAPPWQGPRDESLGAASADAAAADAEADAPAAEADAVRALNAPWKWENLLSEAAVIGGAARWQRRLDGLAHELAAQREMLEREEPESPRLAGIARQLEHLAALHRFALPVIERLAALPAGAAWATWLERLGQLAPRVLRQPEGVLAVLAELAPMAAVGPVGLDEVHAVLAGRLRFLTDEPPAQRYGRVLVATLEQARGRTFDVVFVPGLAERVFPQRPREDPLLLDALRRGLSRDLPTQDERVERERLLLRLAVGAAEHRLYLSYPRVDVAQGRPRVTSFYGLDVARATHGGIPDVEAFEREA
ncbi:MAG: PD-(D/E)XK nuclease family protein, partial [Candidatus Binatia bacterium]